MEAVTGIPPLESRGTPLVEDKIAYLIPFFWGDGWAGQVTAAPIHIIFRFCLSSRALQRCTDIRHDDDEVE
jgi:hypothetical protein